ncbi:hypothetical protein TNCV_2996911 [Trichonephila clavipes]|nr:hypothetical protein TNCV_2996911 [Trichonephila clavipes]
MWELSRRMPLMSPHLSLTPTYRRLLVTTLYRIALCVGSPLHIWEAGNLNREYCQHGKTKTHTQCKRDKTSYSLQMVGTMSFRSGDLTSWLIVPILQCSGTTVRRARCKCVTPANER